VSARQGKPHPLAAEERPFRDARLYVIATEDTHAAQAYFRIFRSSRIKAVKVLATQGGLSAPEHVLARLDAFVSEGEKEDDRWLMLDTDHWVQPSHVANFARVCAEAVQKGYQLAHSNPCFETWLLLHVADLAPAEQFQHCAEVEQRLRDILGSYNKRALDPARFSPAAATEAVRRAEALDDTPGDRWPQKTGSHVYKVVKNLLSPATDH
jgi:hypothetical protein